MNALPKLNPPTVDFVEGVTGPLIGISNSTAAIDAAAWRLVLSGAGLGPQALRDAADAIEEQEYAYAMAILDPEDTGVDGHVLWFQPVPGGQHGPRVKVAINPALSYRQDGVNATVPFDANKKADGPISAALEQQVRAWIALNEEILLKYWYLEISTKKFAVGLKPLPKR